MIFPQPVGTVSAYPCAALPLPLVASSKRSVGLRTRPSPKDLSVSVRLSREPHQCVRIFVRNTGLVDLLIERYADVWGEMRLQLLTTSGTWKAPMPLHPNMGEDPVDVVPSDWITLGRDDEVSWLLYHNRFGRIRKGQKVRVTWDKPQGPVPPSFDKSAIVFPPARWTSIVFVH
jgi:hypothetical protein